MALVIISNKGNEQVWREQLIKLYPGLDVRIYPDDGKKEDIEFALAWNPPKGVFTSYPNLKCIASTGAGVDHIIKDASIPEDVKISRVIDQRLTKDMTAYILTYILAFMRSSAKYKNQQDRGYWQRYQYRVPESTRIGIMGMGELGRHLAQKLLTLGFPVAGWARSPKANLNVQIYTGEDQFKEFLRDVKILVCLLPLTEETRDILSKNTFNQLSEGAYLINVARGEHLVEKDLLEALEQGQLAGACLDVFRTEPLPADHPFWANEKITITPHVASITSVQNVAPQILENYRRMLAGQPLLNEVSRDRGY